MIGGKGVLMGGVDVPGEAFAAAGDAVEEEERKSKAAENVLVVCMEAAKESLEKAARGVMESTRGLFKMVL